jgi:hypothetical protein
METGMVKKSADDRDSIGDRIINELRTANRLLAILATQGMEQRNAIELLHGMSFAPRVIAAALSVTPNAVSIAIHRMKKAEQVTDARTAPNSNKYSLNDQRPVAVETVKPKRPRSKSPGLRSPGQVIHEVNGKC